MVGVIIAEDVVVDVVAGVDVVELVDVVAGITVTIITDIGVVVVIIVGGVVLVVGTGVAVAGKVLLVPDFPPPLVEIMSPLGAAVIVIFPVQMPETKEPVLVGEILPLLSVSVLVPV
jgi:hypothetical protein